MQALALGLHLPSSRAGYLRAGYHRVGQGLRAQALPCTTLGVRGLENGSVMAQGDDDVRSGSIVDDGCDRSVGLEDGLEIEGCVGSTI